MKRLVVLLVCIVVGCFAAPEPALGQGSLGDRIGFEGDGNGDWGLSVMRPDGTDVEALPAPAGAADLVWSASAKQIAFEAPTGAGNLDVFVMNVDGTGLVQVTNGAGFDSWPDWFPGGKQLAYTSRAPGEPPQIWVVNSDGSEPRVQLTSDPHSASVLPSVSPDGRKIVYVRESQTEPPSIYVMNADGSDQRRLTTPSGAVELDPQWSPNGKKVVFSSNRTGTFEVWVMDADGTNALAPAPALGNDFAPTFSPDGKHIAWTKFRQGNGDVWIMEVDGSNVTRVTSAPTFEGFPAWSRGN